MRIGILGGMMDPVHWGHLHAAQAALEAGLDRVLLAPCQTPAHRSPAIVSAAHRLEMCRLAAQADERLQASDIDLRDGPCYAADTVRLLAQRYPDAELCWIIGADKLSTLPRWRDAGFLFTHCTFYVCPRAGEDAQLAVPGARLRVLPAAALRVSSGEAVCRLSHLDDALDLLPLAVSRYIALNGLYQPDYLPVLRQYGMSDQRFRHTLGVRETAVHLAERYGARMQAAAAAALLHDIAKPLPLAQQQSLAQQYGLSLPPEMLSSSNLLHGPLAAAIAERALGVTDAEVLSAIACHTTGKLQMSTLDKVIFLADAIEPSRRDYPCLAELRALAETDLDAAVLRCMQRTRDYVLSKGEHFSPLTELAMQDLAGRKEEKA